MAVPECSERTAVSCTVTCSYIKHRIHHVRILSGSSAKGSSRRPWPQRRCLGSSPVTRDPRGQQLCWGDAPSAHDLSHQPLLCTPHSVYQYTRCYFTQRYFVQVLKQFCMMVFNLPKKGSAWAPESVLSWASGAVRFTPRPPTVWPLSTCHFTSVGLNPPVGPSEKWLRFLVSTASGPRTQYGQCIQQVPNKCQQDEEL